MAEWTFLTNHAIVLVHIAGDPSVRLRDIAAHAGITERAVQQIVRDLAEAGYLTATRVGRRNQYTVHHARPMRHRLSATTRSASLSRCSADTSPRARWARGRRA